MWTFLSPIKNRDGSNLVQAILVLGIFSAAVVGFINLQVQEPTTKQTFKDHVNTKSGLEVRAYLAAGCDQMLQGVTLRRAPATLLTRANTAFPDNTNLTVLASFPPTTGAFVEKQSYPIVVSIRTGDEDPILTRLNVSGTPGSDTSGSAPVDTLTVSECTASAYDRECHRQIEITEHSTQTFEEMGFFSYRTFGKCLSKAYHKYGLQTCIEPYISAAAAFNLCAEFAAQITQPAKEGKPATVSAAQINDLNTYCAFQFSVALNRVPISWAHNLANCIQSGNSNCPETICE